MPELPEVETVRRTLLPIMGQRIESVWWSGKNLRLNTPVDLTALKQACNGAKFAQARRLGKYLLLDLARRDGVVLVHLGMSGRLRHYAIGEPRPKHTHVEWRLGDGRTLRYSDPRRFGNVELLTRGRECEHASLGRLGPDPINEDFNGPILRKACQLRQRAIKLTLLDQAVVAGIGNIYASEALWAAKIHPTTQSKRLSKARCERLAAAVIDVLKRALEHGGTSLKDFVAADGATGDHSHYLWVYDRTGAHCPNSLCSGVIRRIVQQQRATFYCPRCQRP